MKKTFVSIFIIIGAIPNIAFTESNKPPQTSDLIGRLDLSVPENPAFVALGVTPEKVIRPTSGKDFSVALLQGIDANGNFQSGLAIETSPYMMLAGDGLTLKKYKNDYVLRLLSRLKFSLATSSGQSASDTANRVATSLRFNLYDDGDPRLDDGKSSISTCLDEAKRPIVVDFPVTMDPEKPLPISTLSMPAEAENNIKTCFADFERRKWNAKSLDVGIAGYSIDDDNIDETGVSYWGSYAHPIGSKGQFIFSARHLDDLLTPDVNNDGVMDLQKGNIYGARIRWGSNKSAFLIETSKVDIEYSDLGLSNDYIDTMIGFEQKIKENMWIQLAWGKRSGSDLPEDGNDYLSSQLRWGISESSVR